MGDRLRGILGRGLFLGILGLPHTAIPPQALDTVPLRPGQIVFINCPGSDISPTGLRRLEGRPAGHPVTGNGVTVSREQPPVSEILR